MDNVNAEFYAEGMKFFSEWPMRYVGRSCTLRMIEKSASPKKTAELSEGNIRGDDMEFDVKKNKKNARSTCRADHMKYANASLVRAFALAEKDAGATDVLQVALQNEMNRDKNPVWKSDAQNTYARCKTRDITRKNARLAKFHTAAAFA